MFIPSDPVQYKVNWLLASLKVFCLNYFLLQVWAFVTSPFFEYLIFAAICINTVLLAMGFYNQVCHHKYQLLDKHHQKVRLKQIRNTMMIHHPA